MYTNLLFNRMPIRRAPVRRAPVRRPLVYRRPVIQNGGNGNDIFYNGGGAGPPGPIGPPGPPGPIGPPGPPGNPGLVPVTTIDVTPYLVALTDYYLAVEVEAPASVILPVAPTGTVFIVKDIDGDAFTNPITVSAIAATIDGAATATINAPYGSLTFIYNGAEWNIV